MTNKQKILVVEDEPIIKSSLINLLERNDYLVSEASDLTQAKLRLHDTQFDLIISDVRLPDGEGTELIKLTLTPTIIMTSYASVNSAVQALKIGAIDYVAKPFDHETLLKVIQSALSKSTNKSSSIRIKHNTADKESSIKMIGSSAAMQTLLNKIAKTAKVDSNTIIFGETGTGKELVAKEIHQLSNRSSKPFISINCAAIPEHLLESEIFGHEKGAFTGATTNRVGLVEAADQGTLFLDEVGELPLTAQSRLLRMLQEKEIRPVGSNQTKKVDVRLIAATHRNLRSMIDLQTFRSDLFFRLHVIELIIPPLRERDEDIQLLANHFLALNQEKLNNHELVFTQSAYALMSQYDWPGNVRELEHCIERAMVLADDHEIKPEDLGLPIDVHTSYLTHPEANHINETTKTSSLFEEGFSLEQYLQLFVIENQEKMSEKELADKLGISRKTLWEKRQKLGIPKRQVPD